MRPTVFVVFVLAVASLFAGPSAFAAEPRELRGAATPWLWPRSGLEAVSATGPDDVWAAGYQGYQGIDWSVPGWGAGTIHVLPPKGAVVRWNGWSWKTYDLPGFGGDGVVREINAVAPDNVWVTGTLHPHDSSKLAPYVARWDGVTWHQVHKPESGCWPKKPAADSSGAWFACGGGLYRWENGQWSKQEVGAPNGCCMAVERISVVSDTSAWAASTWGILHWDGQRWTNVLKEEQTHWIDVLAVSDTDVWVKGRYSGGSAYTQVSRRWDGQTWRDVPHTPSNEQLIRTGDGNLWALQTYWGDLYRLDGDTWTEVTLPVPADGNVTGGTAIPGSPALWLVGKSKNVPIVINNVG
ncbi:beta propeller repeat protein [Actinomadura rudentiformis]|uniref:Carbohydrate-binding protein n=1 Tax=Actinomadura rudentiformis TaxID=359158 RepID=A0A6H9YJK5_9ACTN|nr:hypothetical protein [Actinomadura rudentiformis]KAB2339184.1 hypothetical protein F8566_48730 [Actinomadura rudentiformis]